LGVSSKTLTRIRKRSKIRTALGFVAALPLGDKTLMLQRELNMLSMTRSRFFFLALLYWCACTLQHKIMPLQGEDPDCVNLSGERKAFLEKTGASRSVEVFIEALKKGDYEKAYSMLGANTKVLIKKEADTMRSDIVAVMKKGVVPGLSVEGSENPLNDLKNLIEFSIMDENQGDYKRANTRVVIKSPSRDPIIIPVFFEAGAWYLELLQPLGVPPKEVGN
jgi:hypothetical protein